MRYWAGRVCRDLAATTVQVRQSLARIRDGMPGGAVVLKDSARFVEYVNYHEQDPWRGCNRLRVTNCRDREAGQFFRAP
jgi:hypothetical protein